MSRFNTVLSVGIGFAVLLIVFLLIPLIASPLGAEPSLDNNHTWTNEQYHQNGDKYGWGKACTEVKDCNFEEPPSPFYGLLGMFVFLGFLSLIVAFVFWEIAPEPDIDRYELFDRWDGRK